jgi:3',5'-cyclic-AMP phosphodiesterase
LLIAQLSDLHIKAHRKLAYGLVDTATMLEQAITHLLGQTIRPDAALITGDLVDYGTIEEYELLKQLLEPLQRHMPIYMIPGNHDHPARMQDVFHEHHYMRDSDAQAAGHYSWHTRLGPFDIIGLDTTVTGHSHGELHEQRLSWLRAKLALCKNPTLIMAHHPPFQTGIGHMDQIGLRGINGLYEVIKPHGFIERILCGHLHRAIQCRFGGTIACTAPSPAHQVVLDLAPNGPDCFTFEPPGYLLHRWDGQCLVTHHMMIGQFSGPFRFREGGVLID